MYGQRCPGPSSAAIVKAGRLDVTVTNQQVQNLTDAVLGKREPDKTEIAVIFYALMSQYLTGSPRREIVREFADMVGNIDNSRACSAVMLAIEHCGEKDPALLARLERWHKSIRGNVSTGPRSQL